MDLKSIYRDYIYSEGPGHTDFPENDIAANRSIATLIEWLGYTIMILFVIGSIIGPRQPYPALAGIGVVFLVTQWAGQFFRIQALEWETELMRERLEEKDTHE